MSEPRLPAKTYPANRRAQEDSLLGGQLLLLIAACGAAILFAFLYITADRAPAGHPSTLAPPAEQSPQARGTIESPGSPAALPPSPYPDGLEAINLEIQHVLVAESPGGSLEKIIVEIPALFPTGTVIWNEAQEARARALLERIIALRRYHSQLAEENQRILMEWNALILESQPADVLRADSPSLPTPPKTRQP